MSDAIAIAIDKAGEPGPKAPEAKAGASTVPAAAPESEEPKADEKKPGEGLGLRAKVPRPVEVTSVPETPVDNRTPAGGTPRPELRLDEEPKEKPVEEAQVILGPGDASPELAATDQASDGKPAEETSNGSSNEAEMKDLPASEATSDSGSGEKRKLDEEPVLAAAANGKKSKLEKNVSDERIKKARVDYVPAQPPTNGKNGKTKREKKFASAVGRTARKTRSQGPVEV